MFGLLKQPAACFSGTTEMLVKQRHRTGNSQANRHVKILSCASKSCPPGETYINDPRRRPIRRHPIRYRMTPIVMRLHERSDRFENGRIFLPVDAPWLDDYIVELIRFPGTKYDDQVDSTTQASDHMRRTMSSRPT
jgi:hypothetical protein